MGRVVAMNVVKERRKCGAVCSVCRSPDYHMSPPYFKGGKPNFTCGSCGAGWQYGRDGGMYAELAYPKEKNSG